MLAGEVAQALGIGVQTLHFYERERLISPPPRSEGGYRIYTPEIVERVRFIRKAQALGFSLGEIKEIFGLVRTGSSPCGRVQAKLAEKLEEVDRRLKELHGFRDELASLVANAAELSKRGAEAGVCSIVEEAPPLPASSILKPSLSRKHVTSQPVSRRRSRAGASKR
jgi:DNA-binding transcriptional MerR regulator